MFIHNFKYILKTLFRSKMLIFWTLAFPIIMGTLFQLAFADIEKSEQLDIIDIAIVNNQEFKDNSIFKNSFETLSSKKNKDRLFNTKYTNLNKAKKLLKNDKISGYVYLKDKTPNVVIATNGINQTILKSVTGEINQSAEIISNLAKEEIEQQMKSGNTIINYEKIYTDAAKLMNQKEVKLKNVSNDNLSYMVIEFYTLIAMTCLYGGMLGMVAINKSQANMGSIGKRVSITPINKGKIVLSSVLAGYVIQLIGIALLLIYTIFILNVDYGNSLFYMILLSIVGSLAGLTLGIAIGILIKSNENVKTGILIAITMLCCFLSGMMGVTMKYIIDKNIGIINKLNPASMITDGFYSLYYYDTLDRFFFNIISLLVFSLIMIAISFNGLRRQKYDSI